jgi:hypothetical protein
MLPQLRMLIRAGLLRRNMPAIHRTLGIDSNTGRSNRTIHASMRGIHGG